MANINLISVRRAERVRMAQVARALTFALFGVGAVGLGLTAFSAGQFVIQRNRIAAADQELARLRPVLSTIEAAEGERTALQPKLVTLTEAQKTTLRWYGIMDGLKRVIPEQTWLTNISVEKTSDGPQTMRINGVTVNQSRVGETMYRLTLQPDYYKSVDLRYTQSKPENQNVEFELAAHLNQPEVEAKLKEAKEASASQTK